MNQPLNFVAHDLDMMIPNQPMLPGPGMGPGMGHGLPPGVYNSTPGFPPGGVGGFGTGFRGF